MNVIANIKSLISLKPHDTSDELGRSKERYRIATWSILSNACSKALALLLMLLSVQQTIPYLGTERFGVWITIASFSGILSICDLGIGNALTNRVAYSASLQNKQELQKTISSGLFALTMIGITLSIILTVIAYLIPWQNLIKVSSSEVDKEIRLSCVIFSALFGLQILASGVQRIFLGLQKAYLANAASSMSSAISIVLIISTVTYQPSIPSLILMTLGCSIVVNLSMVYILIRKHLFLIRMIAGLSDNEYKLLIKGGGLFFILQIGTVIGWGADALIISSILGATQVAVFSIAQKMFQLVTQPIAMINSPFWGAYADAYIRNDYKFMAKTLKISLIINLLIASILGLPLIFWGREISQYWTGENIVLPISLILVFYLWTICESIGAALAMFLNGCNVVKPQVYAVVSLAAIALPLKVYSLKTFGIEGMIFCFCLVYVTINAIMYGIVFRDYIFVKNRP